MTCPLDGKCKEKNLIYQATITETMTNKEETTETYVGLCSTDFKARLGNHKKAFNNKRYPTSTSKACMLCTKEKFYIIFKPHLATLNNRQELGSSCRHKASSLICKIAKNQQK